MPQTGRGRAADHQHHQEPSYTGSSLSSAPLPANFGISLAHVGQPDDTELHGAYIRGAEVVSDVAEASKQSIVPFAPRRGLWDVAEPERKHLIKCSAAAESGSATVWRTAGLAYPCSCNLATYRNAYRPRILPPLSWRLPALPPLEEPHQAPKLGDELLPWSPSEFGELDLDSAQDFMLDFELAWQDASLASLLPPNQVTHADRKGKGKARPDPIVAVHPATPQPHCPDPPRTTALPAPPSSGGLAIPSSTPPAETPPLDHTLRRAWWRNLIDADQAYGHHWDQFPRHVYPSLPRRNTISTTPPPIYADPFRTPRNYQKIPHCFHPDISHYCATARTRVHWLIPIHGPVIVPGLGDVIVNAGAKPWPSRGELTLDTDVPPPPAEEKQPRPVPLRWTPALLKAFLASFDQLYRDPHRTYGPLHLAVSGPKPDPYLALPPARPLESHTNLPKNATPSQDQAMPPVRSESGDHMRIYVDAKHALNLRTWLHWLEVGGGGVRVFERARLALVGPRGEVLVVT